MLVDVPDGHDPILGVQENNAQVFLLQQTHLKLKHARYVLWRANLYQFACVRQKQATPQLECCLDGDCLGRPDALHLRKRRERRS